MYDMLRLRRPAGKCHLAGISQAFR